MYRLLDTLPLYLYYELLIACVWAREEMTESYIAASNLFDITIYCRAFIHLGILNKESRDDFQEERGLNAMCLNCQNNSSSNIDAA